MTDPDPTPLPPSPLPPPPANWGNESEVDEYIAQLAAGALAVVALVHPGFSEPVWVQGAITILGGAIAGGVQVLRSLRKTAVAKIREAKR